MNKHRTPNLYKYIFVLKCLVNKRIMEGNEEASHRGKEIIKAELDNPKDDKFYIGRAEALLVKIWPEFLLWKALKAEPIDFDADTMFWWSVAQEVRKHEI